MEIGSTRGQHAKRNAWITGASTGIGRALALRLARDGWKVAVSARSADKLEALAAEATALEGDILAFPLDVTDKEKTAEAVAAIEDALGPLDLAVLNAGTYKQRKAENFSADEFRQTVEVNLMGAVHGLAPLLPRFMERGRGHVALVASVAGYVGLPTASAYSATKAGLIALAESLEPELKRRNVAITVINPGFVDTPLTEKNSFPMPFLIPVDRAVDAIVSGLEKKRFEIVFPWQMALSMKFLRALPYPLLFLLTRFMIPK
ncbi:SDR family NAD(P)-dependent oxidoreductase [Afifella marina]|uniref:Short-chain dehydrogenase n=1 Tax=Afifella marina DSM 2698 TaxID=1120955 RepID=A0A1G5N0T8_AFIMA|nr:SDR family NAD(P)-dependent oxidoreductase [Afifella marina]MBK1622208.1 oxidoreductase [Afifella marina DSM 2698]MBK1628333.1 oxidoreductase [Afifella marina]MBK5918992.1 oxidoreductase [Afifella marina]RAI20265.1 oxidoreductase [Afifella marina DSM 2698]SCZ30310.1 Short-chain dehydrogenase [Afifella marina DSM 2698]